MSAATQPAFVFDAERHVYRLDGRVLPSVTQILEGAGLVDFSGVPEGVLSAAQWRGSAVHRACHLDDEGDLDESTVEPEHMPYLWAWRAFKGATGFQTTGIEQPLFSRTYLYAGTPDRVGVIHRDKLVVDLKTGEVQPAARLQLAAYAYLLSTPLTYKRLAVRLKPDGTYTVKTFPRADLARDFMVFSSAAMVCRWKAENL